MRKWRKKNHPSGATFSTKFTSEEARIIHVLIPQIIDLLAQRNPEADELSQITGITYGLSDPPEESTLARLLPDFIRLNGDETSEEQASIVNENAGLRSLNEREIVDAKIAALQAVYDMVDPHGGEVIVTYDQAMQWIQACNDVRLTLGTILDIQSNGEPEQKVDHNSTEYNSTIHYVVYQWFSSVQSMLVDALMH